MGTQTQKHFCAHEPHRMLLGFSTGHQSQALIKGGEDQRVYLSSLRENIIILKQFYSSEEVMTLWYENAHIKDSENQNQLRKYYSRETSLLLWD